MKATRREAILAGERRYLSGIPCPKGHVALRNVDNCACVECHAAIRSKNREKQRAYTRVHYQANKAIYLENAAEWGRLNPDKLNAAKRKHRPKWAANNPEKLQANSLRRRDRLATGGQPRHGQLSSDDIKAIVHRQRGRCAACGEKVKLTMDHIMPLALGGGGHRHNFQGLCRPCNSRKRAKHPIDFNRSRGLLL